MLPVAPDEGIENGEDVAAVFDHTREHVAQLWLFFRVLVPLRQHRSGNFDVAPQLLGGMAAKEQAVEKGGFPLRKHEVRGDFGRYELDDRGH